MTLTLPAAGEVHVRCLRLEEERPDFALLSAEEIARAGRFRFEQDRRRWLVCRSALRRMLGAYLGTAPALLRFETGPWGKPSLPDCPLQFNVSHSGSTALLAFAWQQEVGIDVERLRADFSPETLSAQVFSAKEQAALCAFPAERRHAAFLSVWTAKEACVKAGGQGLSYPLDRMTLTPIAGTDRFQVEDLASDGADRHLSVCRLEAGPEFLAALATVGPLTALCTLDD